MIEIICHHLRTIPLTLDGTILSEPQVQESFRSLLSWEWLWGETPHFEFNNLSIRKGMIESPFCGKFEKKNVGDYFNADDLNRFFPDFSILDQEKSLIF